MVGQNDERGQGSPNTSDEVQGTKTRGETLNEMPAAVKLLDIRQINNLRESERHADIPVYIQDFSEEYDISNSYRCPIRGQQMGDTGGFPTQV
jgi:hypothetical protein